VSQRAAGSPDSAAAVASRGKRGGEAAPAAAPGRARFVRLRRRADFLRVARGRKAVTRGLVLQAAPRREADGRIGLGFTASRKVGKAVARNRAKRRLREAARAVMPETARPDTDYVIIARAATVHRRFDRLKRDLTRALESVEEGKPS